MTIAEQLLQQGRIEGVVHGEQELFFRQLRAKFGEVPADYEQLVTDSTPEQLEQYEERVLTEAIDSFPYFGSITRSAPAPVPREM